MPAVYLSRWLKIKEESHAALPHIVFRKVSDTDKTTPARIHGWHVDYRVAEVQQCFRVNKAFPQRVLQH